MPVVEGKDFEVRCRGAEERKGSNKQKQWQELGQWFWLYEAPRDTEIEQRGLKTADAKSTHTEGCMLYGRCSELVDYTRL